MPAFDARVIQLPHTHEAANMFLWRCLDAQKNAASMACRAEYSPKQMHGKGRQTMIDMLTEKGVDFHAYPDAFRLGTFIRRQVIERSLTEQEIERWPPKQRPEPGSIVTRSIVGPVAGVPKFQNVTNRTEFIFEGADPIVRVYEDEVVSQ